MKEPKDNHFILKFNEELEKTKNKLFLIENEIRQIEILTSRNDDLGGFSLVTSDSNSITKTRSVFDLSYLGSIDTVNEAFHEYILNGNIEKLKENDTFHFSENFYDTGIKLAEYYLWLKDKSEKKSKSKNSKLTLNQKLLALYYLGVDFRKYQNNLQSSNILAEILDMDKTNIKESLTYFDGKKSKVKTQKNILEVLELFKHESFKEIYNAINQDVEN